MKYLTDMKIISHYDVTWREKNLKHYVIEVGEIEDWLKACFKSERETKINEISCAIK